MTGVVPCWTNIYSSPEHDPLPTRHGKDSLPLTTVSPCCREEIYTISSSAFLKFSLTGAVTYQPVGTLAVHIMQSDLDKKRDELKATIGPVIESIGTATEKTLKECLKHLLALEEVLNERGTDGALAVAFRDWNDGFDDWVQEHQTYIDGRRDGPDGDVWKAFLAAKDAMAHVVKHAT